MPDARAGQAHAAGGTGRLLSESSAGTASASTKGLPLPSTLLGGIHDGLRAVRRDSVIGHAQPVDRASPGARPRAEALERLEAADSWRLVGRLDPVDRAALGGLVPRPVPGASLGPVLRLVAASDRRPGAS